MPTSTPTPVPFQAPCWVGFSRLSTSTLSFLFLDHRGIESPDGLRRMEVEAAS